MTYTETDDPGPVSSISPMSLTSNLTVRPYVTRRRGPLLQSTCSESGVRALSLMTSPLIGVGHHWGFGEKTPRVPGESRTPSSALSFRGKRCRIVEGYHRGVKTRESPVTQGKLLVLGHGDLSGTYLTRST